MARLTEIVTTSVWPRPDIDARRPSEANCVKRHEEFAEERAGSSEWFELSDRLRAHVDVLAGGADPWDRWHRWVAEATATR